MLKIQEHLEGRFSLLVATKNMFHATNHLAATYIYEKHCILTTKCLPLKQEIKASNEMPPQKQGFRSNQYKEQPTNSSGILDIYG